MSIVLPNAAPPGSLADSIVGADVWRKIRQSKGIEIVSFASLSSQDEPYGREHTTRLPEEKIAGVATRLIQLLRDDRLYTQESPLSLDMAERSVEIRFLDPLPNTQIAIYNKRHAIRFSYDKQQTFYGTDLLLDPIGEPLFDLIRQNAATDERIKRLRFSALPPKRNIPPAGIPANVLRTVRSVRPGMRRADVLRILRPDGGLHGRLERQFVHPKTLDSKGLCAKITLHFAPANTKIRWIGGAGYPVNRQPAHTLSINDAHNTDIVVRVSEPFLGYETFR